MWKYFLVLSVAMIFCGGYLLLNNSYIEEHPTNVTVVDKIIVPGGYKYSGKLTMVVQLEDGRYYDTPVSTTTFALFNKGDKLTFMLSKNDLDVDRKLAFRYCGLPMIVVGLGVLVLLGVAVHKI